MEQTLLLNATFEPLKVVHWQKAITLWFQGKVEVISVYDREVRSVSFNIKLPSVIRLLRHIRIKRQFDYVPFSRANIYARDHSTCQYCGHTFGTNDLTQMTFGFSRDDIGTFLPDYLGREVLPADPFQTLDQTGVGGLVDMAVTKGRGVKKDLKVGICGEHGGDPKSVEFCHRVGMDYVSCSPYRVPVARLAAAQAALRDSK